MIDTSFSNLIFSLIVYLIIGIVTGSLTYWITANYAPTLPYTVCIFINGLIIGLAEAGSGSEAEFLSYPNFISSVILYVFLPILIFGETMNLNWHHTKSGIIQSLWLAGPGVVIGALLMALVSMYIMNWTFPASLLFGAILSATDPVAVVSLLKEVGASHQLTILIAGESILNDGTAIVLFSLFTEIAAGVPASGENVIIFFLKEALGSVLLGLAFGMFTNFIMRFFDKANYRVDISVQTCITVATAYLTFFIAQSLLQISGVLCCATAGLILARFAPPFTLHHEQMHSSWSILEWTCNTLIFFFAGLVAANRILNDFILTDLYLIPVMYLLLMICRAIMIIVLYPILVRGKIPVTMKDSIFITWAGLRGALGIALALQLSGSSLLDSRTQSQILVLVCGIVAITLLVNATFAKALLKYLGLNQERECDQVIALMQQRLGARMEKMLDDEINHFGCRKESLEKFCTFLRDIDRNTLTVKNELRTQLRGTSGQLLSMHDSEVSTLNTDLLSYLRHQFYESIRTRYLHYISIGKMSRNSYASNVLLNSIEISLDCTDISLCDWEKMTSELVYPDYIINTVKRIDALCMRFLKRNFHFNAQLLIRRDKRQVYVISNYVHAHDYCQKIIPTFLGGSISNKYWIPEEVAILKESKQLVKQAQAFLESKIATESYRDFYDHQAARVLLQSQREILSELVKNGAMSQTAALKLFAALDTDESRLDEARKHLHRNFVLARYNNLVGLEVDDVDMEMAVNSLSNSIPENF